jgi:D-glycero-alpha-D-manno-heptose-7-phosphate kinase
MIIVKTPYRVSLFGGGSDFPVWYQKNGGEILAFAINKYSYLTARELPPFFNHTYRLSYSKIEEVSLVDSIIHPAFREGIRKFGDGKSLEIHHHGDLPARSGVGSSSAFAVGLITALNSLNNKEFNTQTIANEAINLEQSILRENVGSQDQITCANGGINLITFNQNNSWKLSKIDLSADYQNELTNRCVIFYSGIARNSSDISKGLVDNFNKNDKNLFRLMSLAQEGKKILKEEGNLDQFGEMLNESLKIKMQMNPLSTNPELSELFISATKAGSLGGKILGAGGGGFCMFWVKKDGREEFLSKFKKGVVIPIKVDKNGVKIIFKDA